MASFLKDRKITRESSKCPWGCGRSIPNGGGPLVVHLGQCKGSPRKVKS